MNQPQVGSFAQFIRRNFSSHNNNGDVTLKWIEDTDVSEDMTSKFKVKVLAILKEGEF